MCKAALEKVYNKNLVEIFAEESEEFCRAVEREEEAPFDCKVLSQTAMINCMCAVLFGRRLDHRFVFLLTSL